MEAAGPQSRTAQVSWRLGSAVSPWRAGGAKCRGVVYESSRGWLCSAPLVGLGGQLLLGWCRPA